MCGLLSSEELRKVNEKFITAFPSENNDAVQAYFSTINNVGTLQEQRDAKLIEAANAKRDAHVLQKKIKTLKRKLSSERLKTSKAAKEVKTLKNVMKRHSNYVRLARLKRH